MYANASNATNPGAYFNYPNQNGENVSPTADAGNEEEEESGVIITEVDDEEDENEFDLGRNRDKFKDYVDAVSLKDE